MEFEEVAETDVFGGCDVCGEDHDTECCPQLGFGYSSEAHTRNTRARKTLPSNMRLEQFPDGSLGVFSLGDIPVKTHYGPFEARWIADNIADENLFVLKVFNKDGTVITLDTSDEAECNWLCLVRCATSPTHHNCMVYQLGVNVFYSTTRVVAAGEELRVWYARFYSKKLAKQPEPDGVTRTMLGIEPTITTVDVDGTLDQTTPMKQQMTDISVVPADDLSDAGTFMELEEIYDVETESSSTASHALDQCFECDRCSKVFHTESLFAEHVRTHFESQRTRYTKKFSCAECGTSFTNAGNLLRHARIHSAVEHRFDCTECNFSSHRTDFMRAHMRQQHNAEFVAPPKKARALKKKNPGPEVTVKRRPGRPRKYPLVEKAQTDDSFIETLLTNVENGCEAGQDGGVSGGHERQAAGSDRVGKSGGGDSNTVGGDTGKLKIKINVIAGDGKQSGANTRDLGDTVAHKNAESVTKCEKFEVRNEVEKNLMDMYEKRKPGRKKGSKNKVKEKPIVDTAMFASAGGRLMPARKNRGSKMLEVMKGKLVDDPHESVKITKVDQETRGSDVDGGSGSDDEVDVDNHDDDETWKSPIKIQPVCPVSEEVVAGEDSEPRVPKKRGRKPIPVNMENIIVNEKESAATMYSCKICLKGFNNLKKCSLHTKTHSGKTLCKFCGQLIALATQTEHVCKPGKLQIYETVDEETKERQFVCIECNAKFNSLDESQYHYLSHTGNYQCKLCGKQFIKRHLLLNHVCAENIAEDVEGEFQCVICKQVFKFARYLYRHMAIHTSTFKCHSCGRCFSRKDSLQRHILACDPSRVKEDMIFQCPRCARPFSTENGLRNHQIKCMKNCCINCGLAFLTEDQLDAHECSCPDQIHMGRAIFQCLVCEQTFDNARLLQTHEDVHFDAFHCPFCSQAFSRNLDCEWHVVLCKAKAAIEDEGKVGCPECGETFTEPDAYREHHRVHTNPHECEKCSKRFRKNASIYSHLCGGQDVINSLVNKCQICKKVFRSDRYLQRHMIVHKRPEYQCEVCLKKFHRPDFVYEHTCKLEDGTWARVCRRRKGVFIREAVVCDLCGKLFSNKSNLTKHRVTHGDRENECGICHKKFHHYNYLQEHIATVHENIRTVVCLKCGKSLKSKASLFAHMNQFHKENRSLFSCSVCKKMFRQKGNLKVHMFSHSANKNFKCEYCQKFYKYPDQLARHKLQHTMSDKLSCPICDKKFVKTYELKAHVSVFHSGRMYVCDLCDAKCTHRHTIVRHFKRKHPLSMHILQKPGYIDSLLKDKSHPDRHGDGAVPKVILVPPGGPQRYIRIMPAPSSQHVVISTPDAAGQTTLLVDQSGAGVSQETFILPPDTTLATTDLSEQTIEIPPHVLTGLENAGDGEPTMVILQIMNENGEIEEVQGRIEDDMTRIGGDVQVQQFQVEGGGDGTHLLQFVNADGELIMQTGDQRHIQIVTTQDGVDIGSTEGEIVSTEDGTQFRVITEAGDDGAAGTLQIITTDYDLDGAGGAHTGVHEAVNCEGEMGGGVIIQ